MESNVQNWILLTLPDHLKEKGSKLIEMSKKDEEKRLHEHSRKKYDDKSLETQAETVAIPLAIARLVMELWSPKMRRHAETLILRRGVREGYLKEQHLKWVHALDTQEEESEETWLIDDQDDIIITLVWDVFDIKTHYSQVYNHRSFVQQSYYRLRDFVPSLQAEIIERHDLSKYAFSQAIGYTLKWVHKTYHTIWRQACDLHILNEPHHPQVWKNRRTSDEKRSKILQWLSNASDFDTGCPYGVDIANLDLNSGDLPEPFLFESYIDMVGLEWERRKGKNSDISIGNLAYIDDRFLTRYSDRQYKIISNLIQVITATDESWKKTATKREKILLNTVPQHLRGICACQLEMEKRISENKLNKALSEEAQISNSVNENAKKAAMQRTQDVPFYIMTSRVVVQFWETSYRNRVEQLIFRKAIEEKLIKPNHVNWILIFKDNQTKMTNNQDCQAVTEDVVMLLWEDFNLREHFKRIQTHRRWMRQSYDHLGHFMKDLPEEVIERHDLSKLSLTQSIGYTLKTIHWIDSPIGIKAYDFHYNHEPHHPEMWATRHWGSPDDKRQCLERWLAGTDSYGVTVTSLDLHSSNMASVFLLESLVEMVALEWERNKDLSIRQLIDNLKVSPRYSVQDTEALTKLMENIKQAEILKVSDILANFEVLCEGVELLVIP